MGKSGLYDIYIYIYIYIYIIYIALTFGSTIEHK